MNQEDTYRAQAATDRGHAEKSDLQNVKDRHARSADAWDVMADRVKDSHAQAEVNRVAKAG